MSNQTLNLTSALYEYILNNSLRESAIQKELREETAKLPNSKMQISPEQGQLMALLVEMIGAKNALEIGVFTGYSALSVALALPKDGKIIACDINKEWTTIAQRYWEKAGISHKIDLRIGPALETLNTLDNNTFDFAFIDADKLGYDAYYEKTLELLRPGGLMLIDNVLQAGRVADMANQDKITVAMRVLNAKIHADPRVHISLVPVSDGITLIRKCEA